jgi:preprotein translocase subunit SecY
LLSLDPQESQPVLSSLRNMFKVPDLRNKIIFTLLILALYRFGSHVPTPGIDFEAVQQLEEQARNGGVLGFLSFFSGGGLTRMAIFGLSSASGSCRTSPARSSCRC